MKIGLVLDNPRRDLTGLLLLGSMLVARGHTVYLIPMYEQGYDVPLLGLDGILVNYARTSNIEFLESYKQLGTAVFVLDTEGGVFPEVGTGSPGFWAERFKAIGADRVVDHYFFWGEQVEAAFRGASGLDATRLHVTGCPRYDICHPRWRSNLSYSRNGYVLANFNFPSINPWWGKAEYLPARPRVVFHSAAREIAGISKIVNVGVSNALPLEKERERAFNDYIAVTCELARRNPGQAFVVRPHPFENHSIYRTIFAPLGNVIVDPSGEVMPVIHNAKFVLHLNCSTSVEARLLGKVPVGLEFLNNDVLRMNVRLPSQISHAARDLEEIDRLIKGDGWRDLTPLSERDFERYIRPRFYRCDGKASERIADLIHDKLSSGTRPKTRRSYRHAILSSYRRARLRYLVQGAVAQALGTFALTRLRVGLHRERGMKYVTAKNVKVQVDRIGGTAGIGGAIKVGHAPHPATKLPLASIRISAWR